MGPDWIGLYLEEDLGTGDVTTLALVGDKEGSARLVARERCFVAGLRHAGEVFARRGATLDAARRDGSWVDAGTVLGSVSGGARAILEAERVALNIVGRMSGIATQTRRLVEALATECSGAILAATRKTTPGFRAFEKEAVVIGGGVPHRQGLYDEAMIKDNHRAVAGSVEAAVATLRKAHPHKRITTEVESLDDALAAARAGSDWVLIDNQEPAVGLQWAETVWQEFPHVRIEASGGITPDSIAQYAWADRISLGWLTHHAVSVDVGLDWA